MLRISNNVSIPDEEIEINAIRASGPGGQHVNKASTAVHLRFDIRASSLPEFYKHRLLIKRDQRISKDGVIVIKAQQGRSQEANRRDALEALQQLVASVAVTRKQRIPTAPGKAARLKRMDSKTRRGKVKSLRGRVRNGAD